MNRPQPGPIAWDDVGYLYNLVARLDDRLWLFSTVWKPERGGYEVTFLIGPGLFTLTLGAMLSVDAIRGLLAGAPAREE